MPTKIRLVDDQSPRQVRVYYGTNRQSIASSRLSPISWILHLGLTGAIVIGSLTWVWRRPRIRNSPARTSTRRGTALLLLLGWGIVGLWSWPTLSDQVRRWRSDELSVHYGPRRSHDSRVYYGYCDVSIPPTHQIGEVEAPLVGPEDESRHVVIKAVEQWEADYFFERIKMLLRERSHEMGCFVFVHGYNVGFQDAAKRTAQIFDDLEFEGVPIFYSWPSRGGVRHYFSDRNEVQFSRELLKEFLVDVVARSEAQRVHVIAHSMGADAVTQAIADIDTEGRIFDQIILAAPDIDAEVFQRQLLPRLDGRSRRTTLYCSRNDLALHMSYLFNDSPRIGDSSRGLLFDPRLDTVDASFIDTELLGHSYYGSCLPILRDVALLLAHNTPPPERNLVSRPGSYQGSIWIFPELTD